MPSRGLTRVLSLSVLILLLNVGCRGTSDTSAGPQTPTTSSVDSPGATPPVPTTTVPPSPVVLAFAGDIHYEDGLRDLLLRAPEQMLAGVREVLDRADLTVVNLESAIGTTRGRPEPKSFTFRAPPSALDALTNSGVDVISMANNHGMDFGAAGLEETLEAIAERAAPVIGIGADEERAFAPYRATIRGQRIAVIAATQVLDSNLITSWTATGDRGGVASAKRVERLLEEVQRARRDADTVVVYLHWGTEKQHCPNAAQLALAPVLADAGADIIVGTHAHRLQGGGYLGSAYVHYGLGNFQFRAGSPEAKDSGILELTAVGREVRTATWHPVRIGGDALPRLLRGPEAFQAHRRWETYRECAKLTPTPTGNENP